MQPERIDRVTCVVARLDTDGGSRLRLSHKRHRFARVLNQTVAKKVSLHFPSFDVGGPRPRECRVVNSFGAERARMRQFLPCISAGSWKEEGFVGGDQPTKFAWGWDTSLNDNDWTPFTRAPHITMCNIGTFTTAQQTCTKKKRA